VRAVIIGATSPRIEHILTQRLRLGENH